MFSTEVQHDAIAFNFLEKVRPCIALWIVATACDAPEDRSCARVSKRRTEIADGVIKFVAVVPAELNDHIVRVFQVPVVDQGHHDLQTLKLGSTDEWITIPLPFAKPFPRFRTRF